MICFIHIEKAAGTTLHFILRNNHPLGYITITPWNPWTNEPESAFSAHEARVLSRAVLRLWGFGGHTTRSFLGYAESTGKPVQYFTFLRDPIKRYLSHFKYQRQAKGIPWSIQAFLDEKRFDDFQTRRIAGRADLDEAKRALREDFSFVGLMERFDESMVLFKHAMALPEFCIHYEIQNVSEDRERALGKKDPEPWKQDPELMERIRAANRLDIELYDYARSEIYPRFVESFGPGLEGAINELTEGNKNFHFRKRVHYAGQSWRYLYYRNFEYFAYRWAHRPREAP